MRSSVPRSRRAAKGSTPPRHAPRAPAVSPVAEGRPFSFRRRGRLRSRHAARIGGQGVPNPARTPRGCNGRPDARPRSQRMHARRVGEASTAPEGAVAGRSASRVTSPPLPVERAGRCAEAVGAAVAPPDGARFLDGRERGAQRGGAPGGRGGRSGRRTPRGRRRSARHCPPRGRLGFCRGPRKVAPREVVAPRGRLAFKREVDARRRPPVGGRLPRGAGRRGATQGRGARRGGARGAAQGRGRFCAWGRYGVDSRGRIGGNHGEPLNLPKVKESPVNIGFR